MYNVCSGEWQRRGAMGGAVGVLLSPKQIVYRWIFEGRCMAIPVCLLWSKVTMWRYVQSHVQPLVVQQSKLTRRGIKKSNVCMCVIKCDDGNKLTGVLAFVGVIKL